MPPRKSRSTTSVTQTNLERLGAERLAALLMDQGRRDRAFRERLALAIAAEAGAEELAEQIERRLITLSHLSRRSRLGEAREREVVGEIQALRDVIVDDVAPSLPGRAIDLLRRFIAMAPTVLDLASGSEGLSAIFDRAEDDLSRLWADHAARDIGEVVEWVIRRIEQEHERAINIRPYERALGESGLRMLADRIGAAFSALPREAVGRRWAHTMGRHYDSRVRAMVLRQILRQIADALGDVDALIAVDRETGGRADLALGDGRDAAIAGALVDRGPVATLDQVGDEIVRLVFDVANGAATRSEALGHREFVLTYKSFEPLGPACLPA